MFQKSHTFHGDWALFKYFPSRKPSYFLYFSLCKYDKNLRKINLLFIIKSFCTSSQHNTYYWCITFLSTHSNVHKISIHIYIMFLRLFMEDFPLKEIFCGRMEIWNDDQPINFPITFTNPSIFEIFIYLRLVSWTFCSKQNEFSCFFRSFYPTWALQKNHPRKDPARVCVFFFEKIDSFYFSWAASRRNENKKKILSCWTSEGSFLFYPYLCCNRKPKVNFSLLRLEQRKEIADSQNFTVHRE